MSQRWQVVRGTVKYKSTLYVKGDFLPENFTSRDRARHIYPRRMALVDYVEPTPENEDLEVEVKEVEVPGVPEVGAEEVKVEEVEETPKESTPPYKMAEKAVPMEDNPEEPPAPPTKPTGTKKSFSKRKTK